MYDMNPEAPVALGESPAAPAASVRGTDELSSADFDVGGIIHGGLVRKCAAATLKPIATAAVGSETCIGVWSNPRFSSDWCLSGG